MRRVALLCFSVIMTAASAVAQPAAPSAPPVNSVVTVTTPSGTYTGKFLRETVLGGTDVYWVLGTDRGETTVSRATIRSYNAGAGALAPLPVKSFEPGSGFELRLHGSNTIGAKLVPEIARGFATANGFAGELVRPGPTPEEFDAEYSKAESDQHQVFRFEAKGSGTAFTGLVDGSTDIGMSSRPVKKDEIDAAAKAGLGYLQQPGAENVIALDGVVIIVNPNNPVASLTMEQISRIFAGEITNWGDVGGTPGPITLYARDGKSGTFDTFKSLVLDSTKRKISDAAKRFESSEQLSESVVRDPSGIGFIGFAYVANAKALSVSTSCGLEFEPEKFTVKTEEYPLSRRLFLYVPPSRRTAAAQALVDYALSAPAQSIVSGNGFIDLNADLGSKAYTKERNQFNRVKGETLSGSSQNAMSSFSERIIGSSRVSITFRFARASSDLDNRALEDLKRLADYIKQRPGSERRIMLFGFADQRTGSEDTNRTLSIRRARQIADSLAALGVAIPEQQVQGYGIIAPVACNDSDAAVEKNRRVEVWLRP